MSIKSPHKISPTRATRDSDWLAVSAAVGRMVNLWSGRFDVAATVGPGLGAGNPAFFNPTTVEVEVNVETCFGADVDPAEVANLDRRLTQFAWPKATGTIFHEALHAAHSLADLDAAAQALSPLEFKSLLMLEESRIEAKGLRDFPDNAAFLRSMVLEIVITDQSEVFAGSASVIAANTAALTLARVDAGSVLEEDIEPLRDVIIDKLGADNLAKLREIWLEVQAHPNDADIPAFYEFARRWAKVVSEISEENGEGDPGKDESGEGDGGEGAGGSLGEFMKDLQDALDEAAGTAAIGAFNDLLDSETRAQWEEDARDRASESRERQNATKVASQVFGKGTTEIHGTRSASRLSETRQPTGEERAAAVKIAALLDRARYRDRDATEISSVTPPGRLRTRAAVQGAALRSKGLMATSEPWRRTVRKHTEDPTLSIGVMVDISGSMGGAMGPMAAAAWVLSEAVRRVQGRVAMVYYGNDVFPTLKPGQHLDKVKVWSAPDGTEEFDKGFDAINGALGLTWGSGARMLVVVSDGCYTRPQRESARQAMQACKRAGVGVLWLDYGYDTSSHDAKQICAGSDAVVISVAGDTAAAALEIGTAAARALELASR